MIFKLLPNVLLRWRDVWLGAVATALLFTLGKFVIDYYLATSSMMSSTSRSGCRWRTIGSAWAPLLHSLTS